MDRKLGITSITRSASWRGWQPSLSSQDVSLNSFTSVAELPPISLEGSWGELFDAIKGWVIIGVLLAVWIGVVLFLSKIFGPKVAGALGAIIFLAVPIGLFIFIAACWGGGC